MTKELNQEAVALTIYYQYTASGYDPMIEVGIDIPKMGNEL